MEQEKLLNELVQRELAQALVFEDPTITLFVEGMGLRPGDKPQSKALVYKRYKESTPTPIGRGFFFAQLAKYFKLKAHYVYLDRVIRKPVVIKPSKIELARIKEKKQFARFVQDTSLQAGPNMVLFKDIYKLYILWFRAHSIKHRITYQTIMEYLKPMLPHTKVRKIGCFMVNLNVPELLKALNGKESSEQTEVPQSWS